MIIPNENMTPFDMTLVMFLGLLELSCGKIEYIPESFYLLYGISYENTGSKNMRKYQ